MEHLGDLFERVVAFLDLHPARLARWAREVKVAYSTTARMPRLSDMGTKRPPLSRNSLMN